MSGRMNRAELRENVRDIACEQAVAFGRVKRVSRERLRVLTRLALLAQIGELARSLPGTK